MADTVDEDGNDPSDMSKRPARGIKAYISLSIVGRSLAVVG